MRLQGWRQPVYQNLLVDLTDERVKGGSLEVKIAQKRRASPATCIQYPPPPTDRMHQHTCKDEISSEKNKHKELLPPQAERTRFALRLRAGLVLQHHQSSSVSGAGDGLPTSYRALLIIMAPGSTAVRIAAGSQCKGIAPNLKVCGYHFIFSIFYRSDFRQRKTHVAVANLRRRDLLRKKTGSKIGPALLYLIMLIGSAYVCRFLI